MHILSNSCLQLIYNSLVLTTPFLLSLRSYSQFSGMRTAQECALLVRLISWEISQAVGSLFFSTWNLRESRNVAQDLILQTFEDWELRLKSSFATHEWLSTYLWVVRRLRKSPTTCDWCEIVICGLKYTLVDFLHFSLLINSNLTMHDS